MTKKNVTENGNYRLNEDNSSNNSIEHENPNFKFLIHMNETDFNKILIDKKVNIENESNKEAIYFLEADAILAKDIEQQGDLALVLPFRSHDIVTSDAGYVRHNFEQTQRYNNPNPPVKQGKGDLNPIQNQRASERNISSLTDEISVQRGIVGDDKKMMATMKEGIYGPFIRRIPQKFDDIIKGIFPSSHFTITQDFEEHVNRDFGPKSHNSLFISTTEIPLVPGKKFDEQGSPLAEYAVHYSRGTSGFIADIRIPTTIKSVNVTQEFARNNLFHPGEREVTVYFHIPGQWIKGAWKLREDGTYFYIKNPYYKFP